MLPKSWQPTVLPDPTPLSKITPAQALARWLVLVWERPGGEGNDLLKAALPGSLNITVNFNWPLSVDVDDVLVDLVRAGWLEQVLWCPDLSMARYVAPGAPTPTKSSDGIGVYAAGWYYRPLPHVEYEAFVAQFNHLLKTLPRNGKISIGDRVRLTSAFLASTGQTRSIEAKMVWTVKPCTCTSCASGRHLAVNSRRDTPEVLAEYAADPEYCDFLRQHPWRHIAVANLRKVAE